MTSLMHTCFTLQYVHYSPIHVSSITRSSSGGRIVLMQHLVSFSQSVVVHCTGWERIEFSFQPAKLHDLQYVVPRPLIPRHFQFLLHSWPCRFMLLAVILRTCSPVQYISSKCVSQDCPSRTNARNKYRQFVIRNWWPTRCNFLVYLFVPNQQYMFRAMFSPIMRSTWLYLQLLI